MDEIDHLMGKGPAKLDDVNNVLWDISSDLRDLKDETERKTEDLIEVLVRLDQNLRRIKDVLYFIGFLVLTFLIGEALDWTPVDWGSVFK